MLQDEQAEIAACQQEGENEVSLSSKNEAVARDNAVATVLQKPPGVSWCTFFQKVAATVGVNFDFSTMPGRQALSTWKDMTVKKRQDWQKQHEEWSRSQGCSFSTPQKKSKELPSNSPSSTEKEVQSARLPDLTGPEPQFTSRVTSVQGFHKRWSFLKKQLQEAEGSSFFLQQAQTLHLMYLDVVSLLDAEKLKSCSQAESEFRDYRINRLKVSRTQAWLAEQECQRQASWAPQEFSAGRHGSGLLTIAQKQDVLRHILAMSGSNKSMFPHEVKQAMFKMVLLNKKVVTLEEARDRDLPWKQIADYQPTLDGVYKDFRAWVKQTYPDKVKIINAKVWSKSGEEAAAISPATINQHFDALEQFLIDCKLMCPDTRCLLAGSEELIWTCDEKGLSGQDTSIKMAKALTISGVKATRETKDKSFGHITLLPFCSLKGDCAPPFVFVKGAAEMKSWKQVWESATVMATENGSCTTALFTQVLGLFGKFVREELRIAAGSSVAVLMDSGGGAQIHISPEASLIADTFGLRLFFFRKNMTPAVCSLDQRPNLEAEKRFHQIIASGADMTSLGALLAARDVPWDFQRCKWFS